MSPLRPLALLLLACACRPEPLANAGSSLHFELLGTPSPSGPTPTLDFGTLWTDGVRHPLQVKLVNMGRRPLELVLTQAPSLPFTVELPATVPPGETLVTLSYLAQLPGLAASTLTVSAPDVDPASLALAARALPIPDCRPSDGCHRARFDLDAGACADDDVADGTACDPNTRCIPSASCQAGRCVGTPLRCDDGNACTVDVCHASTGCEFLPAPPCQGESVCSAGVCDPVLGCRQASAPDGTRCGPQQDCEQVQICLDGACVPRRPPEGAICEEASPCNDVGRCQGSVCVHASPAWPLQARWRFDSLATGDPDAGVPAAQYHDFVLEPSGAMTLGGFFTSPGFLRANVVSPPRLAPQGGARRCILWGARLVCADYPAQLNGKVTALDLDSGLATWTFDLRTARPDFLALTTTVFLARLVVQGPDRLAALFEAYPAVRPDAGADFCRAYFLVILDSRGALVSAQPIADPLLSVCNHPHPYGAAADAVGNLALAFSPTISAQAPLLPAAPTLLLSYTHDGLFRWKRLVEGMPGGELAVARGLLYPENSPTVLSAATGEPAFSLPAAAGRIVVADARHVPAPVAGGTSLSAYEAGGATLRWTHALPPGFRFFGDQLRLATWATSLGPRTVALTFLRDVSGGLTRIHAVDVQNGLQGFSCEVEVPPRTEPQLFEVADGRLGVMGGALDPLGGPACERCDPPRAYSSAAFESLDMPGLSRAREPWPGTFGGPSHDHQEKVRGPP